MAEITGDVDCPYCEGVVRVTFWPDENGGVDEVYTQAVAMGRIAAP